MPRLTKVQKLLLEQQHTEMINAALEVEYFPNLIMALEAATSLENNFSLRVIDGNFVVFNRNLREEYVLSPVYNDEENHTLNNLTSSIHRQQTARAQSQRELLIRQGAINKLTAQEKEVLGL
jgi:hypothetical protein